MKSFGSIDAETTATGASIIRPPRRTSGGANPTTPSGVPQKKLDVHSLFGGKPPSASPTPGAPMSPSQAPQVGSPVHDRRQSLPQAYPGANGLPNSAPHPYQQMAQPHLRPPQGAQGQPRSPVMGVAQPQFGGQVPPQQQGFRVPQPQMQGNQPAVRPGSSGPMGVPRPMMGAQPYMPHGQAPGYQMMYPPQGAYYVCNPDQSGADPQYNPYDQQQYMQQQGWAPPQQHAPNMPMSPRSAQAQLGNQASPAPPNAPLPTSAGGSPMPTPPSRPQSLVGGHQSTPSNSSPMPTTPSRPLQAAGTPFTPQQMGTPTSQVGTPSLSAGAVAFTPRAKATIKISRPDGTSLNLAEAAAAAKGPSTSSSGVVTPDLAAAAEEVPKKKMPTLPVIVRLESEEQKKARLAEEEKLRKIKEQEAKEEEERKARVERRVKEEEERKAKEEEETKAKEVAETQAKEEAEVKAKEAAEVKAKEEAEAKKAEETPVAVEAPKAVDTPEAAEEEKSAETPVADKAEEARRALLTPTTQSAVASPLASPALAAAGLPAKPVAAALNGGAARRPTMESKSPSQASPAASTAPSALTTAKPIEDLTSVAYPESVKPQRTELNVNGEPGKFRYDRDFLLQFMEVCKDKPDTLPPLEEIGLEAESSSSGFGGRRGNRSSAPGSSRSGMGMGGIMGTGRSFTGPGAPGGMGSFNFSTSSMRGTTSEDRYRSSLAGGGARGSAPGMARTGSSGFGMDRRSNRGTNSQRGKPRMPVQPDPDVAPLAVSANAWVNARSAPNDDKSPVYIERKVKALLNKLTEEKFDSIAAQILEWANKSREETDGMTLKLVIKLVFEKSTDEAHWSAMYAKLCRLLLDRLDPAVSEVIDGKVVAGGSLFRKYLLGRCQADFEAGWKAREEAAASAAAKSEQDKERLAEIEAGKDKDNGGEVLMMSDEYYIAQKAKRRGLGLVQLIGELYKLEMLSKSVIRECLVRLLGNVENPDEEDLESTCKLLTTVGKQFEETSARPMDVVFERLLALTKNDLVSSRIRFMIMDVVDLRRNKWNSRKEVVPTTIAQIHQQAARENAEKAQAARESLSRGGSRAGHSRREGAAQPGEWQSVAAGPRPPQRPTDFSNIGRGVSSAGLPSAPTFGPSGVFARGKKGAAGATPPISRHSSTTNMSNMFGALVDAESGAAESADAPQRKKLQLAPRTKPIPTDDDEEGSDAEGDEDEDEDDDDGEAEAEAAPAAMTAEAAKAKIDMDVKELWGEKDAGGSRNPDDIVEYYRSLPAEHRGLLSEKLGEDVFRIAKYRDAEVVAKGWKKAVSEDVASVDDLKAG